MSMNDHTYLTDDDWGRGAGIICNGCNKEAFRSRDGLCMDCWDNANDIEIRDKAGVLHWLSLDVIMAIVRPARKTG